MRSDLIKEGPSRAPHRSLLRALGIDELEMKRPFIAVVNSKSDYIPGHMHLDKIAERLRQVSETQAVFRLNLTLSAFATVLL